MIAPSHDIEERLLRYPPVIQPVAQGIDRPVWSVMIPVFNCSRFLPRTLESVLLQDEGTRKMQITVVDDASTDTNVERLVNSISGGRVEYIRQKQNVGSLKNFQTCLEESKGHLIHLLHGDDVVREGFYKKIYNVFERHPGIGAAYCRFGYIDENDRCLFSQAEERHKDNLLDNWLERISEKQLIQYASIAVRRNVYETLGGFYGVEYGEDWEMWVRIASKYSVGYVPEILADYRRHASSISGRSFETGKNMRDLRFVMDRIREYLPHERRETILEKTRHFYAHYALNVANSMWIDFKNRNGAISQVREALKLSKDPMLIYRILKLYTRLTLNI